MFAMLIPGAEKLYLVVAAIVENRGNWQIRTFLIHLNVNNRCITIVHS